MSPRAGSKEATDPFQLFSELAELPALIAAEALPLPFEDSTHQLWRCQTSDGEMVLKLCQQDRVDKSPTWQVIKQLFDFDLSEELSQFDKVQQIIEQYGLFPVPELVAFSGQKPRFPAFVLNRFVEGQSLHKDQLTDELVLQFARHVSGLHVRQQAGWGKLYQADRKAESWPECLLKALVHQAEQQTIGEPWLSLAVAQLAHINPRQFAPLMLDNRWDQFLVKAGKITALTDLDAFVFGPVELELILLEYQLDKKQAALFASEYQKTIFMPDLSQQRLCYRLLLFLMNALGERDIDRWMQAPVSW